MIPWANPNQSPLKIAFGVGSTVLAGLRNRPTDDATPSVAIGRILSTECM